MSYKISELTAFSALADADLFVAVDGGATGDTKKITWANLVTSLLSDDRMMADGKYFAADIFRARDGAGTKLFDDDSNGLTIADGGAASFSHNVLLAAGKILFLGDTVNSKMTAGITLNQGAASNEAFSLKSSEVNHPMTTLTELDTCGTITRSHSSYGGFRISGYTDGDTHGLLLVGNIGTETPTATNAGVLILAYKTDGGTNVTNLENDETVCLIQNGATPLGRFEAGGKFSLFDFYDFEALKNSNLLRISVSGASHEDDSIQIGRDVGANQNKVGIGMVPTANMVGLSIAAGVLTIAETTTPTADADYGKIYCKADDKIYFQDGAGSEHEIAFA